MKRARNTIQKENRREKIMETALDLFATEAYEDISMNRLAKTAGLAKGTLYLYFETKEELFLAIFGELFQAFFDDLNNKLGEMSKSSAEEMADFAGSFIASRPTLMRLMSLSHTVLEKNTKAEAIVAYKTMAYANTARTGENLERLLSFLKEGEGAGVVLAINSMILGVQQMTDPPPNVIEILDAHPDLNAFNLDSKTFLTHLIFTHLEGLKSKNT